MTLDFFSGTHRDPLNELPQKVVTVAIFLELGDTGRILTRLLSRISIW